MRKAKTKPKIVQGLKEAIEHASKNMPKTEWWAHMPTEPASFISRLEAATVKYEQAIKQAVIALEGGKL